MGTDIYLNWKKQTEDEKKAQITGFRNNGDDGYLRASIGSIRENQMLRILFSEEYWNPTEEIFNEDLGVPYDFLTNEEFLQKALAFYLHGTDEEDTITESLIQQTSFGLSVMAALSGLKGKKTMFKNDDLEYFSNEVKKFYELGKTKNQAGIKTYIDISW